MAVHIIFPYKCASSMVSIFMIFSTVNHLKTMNFGWGARRRVNSLLFFIQDSFLDYTILVVFPIL